MLALGHVGQLSAGETGPSHPIPYLSPECSNRPQPPQDTRSAFLATDTGEHQASFLDRSPIGKGCINCPNRSPALELESGAFCLRCIGLWFPDWNAKQVRAWVSKQKREARQIAKEKERLANEL